MKREMTKLPPALPEMPKLLRVAAYTRVSSGKEAMMHSLSTQVSYYSELIQNTPGWAYVGVYCEEGRTGTLDSRPEFQRLLKDCRAGKIDLILVKAISRLARNTLTFLSTVRELKELGVDIYFENERINAISATGELMMTLIAGFMQEESRAVSENCKWRIQQQFEAGQLARLRYIYGYRIRRDVVTIEPDEARVVQGIFESYVSGIGTADIVRQLRDKAIPTLLGGEWTPSRVREILHNEKYTGNALLQKTFIEDHLTKREVVNRGQRAQYYAEGTHPPIIDMATFERAQAMLARNSEAFKAGGKPRNEYPLTGMIVCGNCGKHYHRKLNHGRAIWHCRTYLTYGKAQCAAKAVPEEVLTKAIGAALAVNDLGWDDLDTLLRRITVPERGIVVFELVDGRQIDYRWEPRSRSESWDDAARQRAREHTQKRWQK